MALHKIEGIVLKSLQIKEHDRILTLMTKESGMVKLYCKASRNHGYLTEALWSVFTKGEFVFALTEGELGFFREGTVLSQNLRLHDSYESLKSAYKINEALLRSQSLHKPAPLLYLFFDLTLEKLPSFPSSLLLTTFFLKLLKHEGYLQLDRQCTCCVESYRLGGELFCKKEAPPGALLFSESEEKLLSTLAEAPSFSTLASLSLPPSFSDKIALLFSQAFTY